jgi:hypothetical protein
LELITNVSGQPIGPIFKGLNCLSLEDGTNTLSRNIGN